MLEFSKYNIIMNIENLEDFITGNFEIIG